MGRFIVFVAVMLLAVSCSTNEDLDTGKDEIVDQGDRHGFFPQRLNEVISADWYQDELGKGNERG